MTLFKKIPFMFEEKNYEIRVYYDDAVINVVAFQNNYPANGLRHQIKIPKNQSPQDFLRQDVVEELAEMSRNDIRKKMWERLQKS